MRRIGNYIRRAAIAAVVASVLPVLNGCKIEPDLYLPSQDIVAEMPIVDVDLQTVWHLDIDWENEWFYGWDEEDSIRWGGLSYPEPESWEIRRYYLGDVPDVPHTENGLSKYLIEKPRYRDRWQFGYHDLLVWTGFGYLPYGQAVIIDERDLDNVYATTSPVSSVNATKSLVIKDKKHYNCPEIFYRAYDRNIFISRDTADYDYFDPVEKLWVKNLKETLTPAVYIYMVQVILYNNKGKVVNLAAASEIDGLARITNVTTGYTLDETIGVVFDMRLKNHRDKKGTDVDVIGGKMTTFGLSGQKPYTPVRSSVYDGANKNVQNYFGLNLKFNNNADSTYYYNVTDQFQRQVNGGIITVEINIDTLDIPVDPTPGSGSGFDPYVQDYEDQEYEIPM